jgi:phosphate transport system substrate-binding protein
VAAGWRPRVRTVTFPTSSIDKHAYLSRQARRLSGRRRNEREHNDMRFTKTIAVLAAAMLLAVPAAASAKTLIGSGSTAAEPYLLALFQGYKKKHKNINFIYTANGGNAGVKDVQEGRSQFAGQARLPLPSDAGTTYVKLFLDGLCIVANPANKLTNITTPTLRDIFLANITNWSQVPGSGLDTTIAPVGRDSNGGTYNFFVSAILNNQPPASNVNALTTDALVKNAILTDDNAIGYNGLPYTKDGKLKKLKLDGVACEPKKIKNLDYPLSRYLWLVLPTSSPSRDVQKFADWVRTSADAGTIITKVGGVPAFNKKPKKKKHH